MYSAAATACKNIIVKESGNYNGLYSLQKKGGGIMSRYIVEASRKKGFFEPYESRKYYLVSEERLSKMLLQTGSWAVWSAKWVNPALTSISQLKEIYGEIEEVD